MSTEYFLKIDGIPGEATDAGHTDEIKVVSWTWGATATPNFSSTGTIRPDIQDLHVTTRTSRASPLLFIQCATGTHAKTADLIGRKPGSPPVDYLKISLTDVQITSYQAGGSANDDLPLDQVSLTFGKIQVTFTPFSGAGQGVAVTRAWDVLGSRKV